MEYVIVLICILFMVLLINVFLFKPERITTVNVEKLDIPINQLAEKISGAIKFRTISRDDYNVDFNEYEKYIEYIKNTFPLVHENLELTIINDYSLLYKWKGNGDKLPCLLMAHYDVVPANDTNWEKGPFAGIIEDKKIIGRGTLDDKSQMISQLEAVEQLLKKDFKPNRDLYFAYGHDEEVGGFRGAANIAKYLRNKNIKLDIVLDEGGAISRNIIDGIYKDVAVIGIAEKGFANITLTATSTSGHASNPPKQTSLGKISEAIYKIERKNMKHKMTYPVEIMFKKIGPHMSFINRLILSNMWLFKSLFIKIYSNNLNGNAQLRTTIAPTMASGSLSENVLSKNSTAVLNCRISHNDSIDKLLKHIKNVVGNEIHIKGSRLTEPSNISSIDSFHYKNIEKLIYSSFDNIIVTPYLMTACTDSVHYQDITNMTYRFAPLIMTKLDQGTIHAHNEYISFENLENCVNFYYNFIKITSEQ